MTELKVTAVWDAMDRSARKVAIARDAIERLLAGQYLTDEETYLERDVEDGGEPLVGGLLSDWLREGKPCKACAIGGMFASWTVLSNGSVRQADTIRGIILESLSDAEGEFDEETLDMIENLFELRTITWSDLGLPDPKVSWWAWGSRHLYEAQRAEMADTGVLEVAKALRHLTRKERMLWIMRNIADNGGDLVVGKLTYS